LIRNQQDLDQIRILEFYPRICFNTDKKENEIFLIYKEIQMGSVAKSFIRKCFLIEEMCKYLTIYEEGVIIYDFATDPF
jgi:hypothetical protein